MTTPEFRSPQGFSLEYCYRFLNTNDIPSPKKTKELGDALLAKVNDVAESIFDRFCYSCALGRLVTEQGYIPPTVLQNIDPQDAKKEACKLTYLKIKGLSRALTTEGIILPPANKAALRTHFADLMQNFDISEDGPNPQTLTPERKSEVIVDYYQRARNTHDTSKVSSLKLADYLESIDHIPENLDPKLKALGDKETIINFLYQEVSNQTYRHSGSKSTKTTFTPQDLIRGMHLPQYERRKLKNFVQSLGDHAGPSSRAGSSSPGNSTARFPEEDDNQPPSSRAPFNDPEGSAPDYDQDTFDGPSTDGGASGFLGDEPQSAQSSDKNLDSRSAGDFIEPADTHKEDSDNESSHSWYFSDSSVLSDSSDSDSSSDLPSPPPAKKTRTNVTLQSPPKRSLYTEKEEHYLRTVDRSTKTDAQIAEEFNRIFRNIETDVTVNESAVNKKMATLKNFKRSKTKAGPWTKEEDDIVRKNYQDLSAPELAKLLPGRTPASIHTRRKNLDLPVKQLEYTKEELHKVKELQSKGLEPYKILEIFNRNPPSGKTREIKAIYHMIESIKKARGLSTQ